MNNAIHYARALAAIEAARPQLADDGVLFATASSHVRVFKSGRIEISYDGLLEILTEALRHEAEAELREQVEREVLH